MTHGIYHVWCTDIVLDHKMPVVGVCRGSIVPAVVLEDKMMRFVYGIIALFLWSLLIGMALSEGFKISNSMQWLTCALVTAGAMAGGD